MRTPRCATVLGAVAAVAVVLGCVAPACAAAAAEPLGCGGFVRLSEAFRARGSADLSAVRVELRRGSTVTFATECSPAGYFFLPAYEPGEYTVAVDAAAGYAFDTAAQRVTLGAGAAPADALAFTVTGFTVAGALAAPVATRVELRDAATGAAVATATADAATGAFAFAGVLPGAYVAAPVHDGWSFAPAEAAVDATGRVPATLNVPARFAVTGYDVRGAVERDGKTAPELVFALYRDAGSADNSARDTATANGNKKDNSGREKHDSPAEKTATKETSEKPALTQLCGEGSLKREEVTGLEETEAAQGLRAAAFVCAVRSRAADGAFVLRNVAPGAYVLAAHRADADGTAYDVAPARVSLTVDADAVALDARFRVTGLRVAGTVAAPDGHPLAGVTLTARARGSRAPAATAVSDAAGRYRLAGVRAGAVLDVDARAPEDAFIFAPLRAVTVAPGAAALRPLRALGTRVSGRVAPRARAASTPGALALPCTLAVLDAAGARVSTVITARDGTFATHLPDGTYTLRVVRTDRGGSSDGSAPQPVPGAPADAHITVASAPVADVVLRQETFTYSGTVRFMQACPRSLRVYLTPIANNGDSNSNANNAGEARDVLVEPEGGNTEATVGTFTFEDVPAGAYEVSVVAPGTGKGAARGALCFAQERYNVTVARAPAPPTVVFAQMGYRVTLAAPVPVADVALTCAADPGLLLHQPLHGAPVALCVSTPGRWRAAPSDPFARFDRAEYDVYAAPEPSPVATATFVPVAYRVRGTVQLAPSVPPALLPRVSVVGTVSNTTTTAKSKNGKNSKNSKDGSTTKEKPLEVDTEIGEEPEHERELYYAAWLRVGERATFAFKGPEGVVFYPSQHRVTLRAASDATARLPLVAARPEVVLRGRVEPPTAGVQVTVLREDASGDASGDASASEGTVVAQTETDAEGRYVVRGLRDDVRYRELFAAPGLALEAVAPRAQAADELVVAAVRRAALTVRVRGAADGAPVAGVLVALSGGAPDAPYHASAATGADGTLTTGELAPGEYYARPLLKEYAFAPPAAAVAVARGAAPVVDFAATRTAYSVFGRVVRLDQHPTAGLTVVASPVVDDTTESSSNGASTATAVAEQAITDENGAYRIRGLVPGVRYTVRLDLAAHQQDEENGSENKTTAFAGYAFPGERTVVMGAEDVHKQGFVAVPLTRGAAAQVLGHVAAADTRALAQMEAVLSCNGSAVQVVPLARLPVFGFAGLRAGAYDVALRQTAAPGAKQAVRCTAQPAHVAVTLARAAVAEVRFTVACADDEGAVGTVGTARTAHRTTSVWSLVAIAVAGAMLARYERVVAVALDVFGRAQQWVAEHRGAKQPQNRKSGRKPLQQSRGALAQPMTAEDRAASFLPEHLLKKKK